MNLPPKIYLDVAAALLAALTLLIWSIRRRRRDRLAIYRVEPGNAGAADANPRPGRDAAIPDAPAFGHGTPDYPRLTPADHKLSRFDAEALAAQPAAGARDYKGFKICLNEKRPGLWIAAVKRPGPRKKKGPVKDSELWITPEYYQLSAALTDAMTAIDRGAVSKPVLPSSD